MEKYMLISVSEREIETAYFEDYQAAYDKMIEEVDETGDRADYNESDDYGLKEFSAYSNMNHHCNCDWLIVELPVSVESESDGTDTDELTRRQTELCREIAKKRNELIKVDAALKKVMHKPARQLRCCDLLKKLPDFTDEMPIVVYEGIKPKKITRVIVSKNHVRLEISANLQIDYQDGKKGE